MCVWWKHWLYLALIETYTGMTSTEYSYHVWETPAYSQVVLPEAYFDSK